MEAEDGSAYLTKATVTSWKGDWSSFKQRFRAAGNLNGIREALRAGELLASGDAAQKEEDIKTGVEKLAHQSEKLAALLVLALEPTKGPQRSLVINVKAGEEDNGVQMWANLIKHFETSTREVRIASLLQQWEKEELRPSEHPDELHGRLTATNSKLVKPGRGALGSEAIDALCIGN